MVAVGRNVLTLVVALAGCKQVLGLDPGTVVDGAAPRDGDSADGPPSGTYRKTIMIKTGGSELLENFPVPIIRDADADLAARARDDARDIQFVMGNEVLELDLVSFSGVTGAFEAWVKIPRLQNIVEIEVRYGSGVPLDHDASQAWEPMFAGVWHMGQSAIQTYLDSTSHVHHGAALQAGQRPLEVVGRAGLAASFDGNNDSINVGDPADGSLDFAGGFTLSAWVMVTSSQGMYDMAVAKGGSSIAAAGYDLELGTTNWGSFVSDGNATAFTTSFGNETDFLGTWAHLAVVLDRGANQVRAYSNGAQQDVTAIPAGFGSIETTRALVFGDPTYQFKGVLDEVHISNTPRSAAWIDAEYELLANPSQLISIGLEEAL